MGHGLSAFVLALSVAAPALAAGPYPTKPIRFIVNTVPAGSIDLAARTIAQHMSEKLGQSICQAREFTQFQKLANDLGLKQ